MNSQTLLVITSVLALISVGLALYAGITLRKTKQIRTLLSDGTAVENLEEILSAVGSKIKKIEGRMNIVEAESKQIQETITYSISKIGIHRFNSLADEGGNLSFALALLDDHNSGAVLTSLYGRTQNRIYSKLVTKGLVATNGTEEEQQAITSAINQAHATVKK